MSKQQQVIIFCGPKNSGKDSLVDYLVTVFPESGSFQFKEKLLEDTCDHYGVNREWFDSVFNNRATKETPLVELDGKSPRQAMIHVSEEIIKPQKGIDIYGKELADEIAGSGCDIAFVSDGGVNNDGEWVEIIPLIERFGAENMHIVSIYRPGCSFEGDSRCYWQYYNITSTPSYLSSNLSLDDNYKYLEIMEGEMCSSKSLENVNFVSVFNTEDLELFFFLGRWLVDDIIQSKGVV